MRSTGARIGIVVVAVAVAVVLFVVLSGGDDDDGNGGGETTTVSGGATTTTSTGGATEQGPEVLTVRNGEPVGGVKTLTYEKGDRVNFLVRLNQPEEEIHVHGYEISEPAEQSPVRLSFPARIDGIFEIEVHGADGSDAQIAELRVNP
jgi:hypothetical protein